MLAGNTAISASAMVRRASAKPYRPDDYAAWDRFEALSSVWRAEDHELAAFVDADTVFYTPEVVNSPRAVADGVTRLCTSLRSIRDEPQRRAERAAAMAQASEEARQRQERLLEVDWFAPPSGADEEPTTTTAGTYHAGPPAAAYPRAADPG